MKAKLSFPLLACVVVIASFPAPLIPAPVPKFQFGSWTQVVKSSTWPTDADKDDPVGTVGALHATGQAFIVYNIDSWEQWNDFLALVRVAAASKPPIQVYAAVDAPHLLAADMSRWFEAAGVDPIDMPHPGCDSPDYHDPATYDKQHECLEHWLAAWKAAATEVSSQSLSYPNIKGFVINDFDGYVESLDFPACRFGDRLTHAEVSDIQQSVKSMNPDLGFWPVCYPHNFGRVIGDGYLIGVNYGVHIFKGDEMSVTLSFYVGRTLPVSANLHFLHADTVTTTESETDCYASSTYKEVVINDATAIWSESVAGDQSEIGRASCRERV